MNPDVLLDALFLALHALLLVLFLRTFLWKSYADHRYWRAEPQLTLAAVLERARAEGRPLPYVSLFVPAREETAVIARTIEHLTHLEYPADRYEVIVVTDEKEQLAAAREREAVAAAIDAFLSGRGPWPRGTAEAVLLAVLVRLTLLQARTYRNQAGPMLERLLQLPGHVQEELLFTIVRELWQRGSPGHPRQCVEWVQRRLGRQLPASAAHALGAALFGLALTAVAAAARLRGEPEDASRLQRLLADARSHLTRRAVETLAEGWSARTVRHLQRLHATHRLSHVLRAACALAVPTTQEVVERCLAELADRPSAPRVKHTQVPWDYDGRLDGVRTGREVPSTKGRALNYAARFAEPGSQVFGYYDAEARPDRRVLLHVAARWLNPGGRRLLLQGPVFQVRNFHRLGPMNKIAALYQSISHNWYLPVLMRSLPFVGGTNFFIERRLFEEIGGFDPSCLSEDLEIGVRSLLRAGVWPEYLPVVATEQTPATFAAYFRQRFRWGCGWLQVYRRLLGQRCDPQREPLRRYLLRQLWLRGHVQWVLYQLVTVALPLSWWLSQGQLEDGRLGPVWLDTLLRYGFLPYLAFTWYCFARYLPYMDPAPGRGAVVRGILHTLLLPVAAFCFPLPFTAALVAYALGAMPNHWVKTPRTAE